MSDIEGLVRSFAVLCGVMLAIVAGALLIAGVIAMFKRRVD